MAVECCLRSFVKAFCCDNYKDEAVLQELMTRFYPKGNRPQIIVSPFSDKLYNIHGRSALCEIFFSFSYYVFLKLLFFLSMFCFHSVLFHRKAYHPEYPSVMDIITATSPVIINCLIDMRGIESILIIKVSVLLRPAYAWILPRVVL